MNAVKSIFSPLRAWKYLVKPPVTLPKRFIFEAPREASDSYRGFHQNDLDACIGCGTCSEICPTAAITLVEVEGIEATEGKTNTRPAFDYGRCSFCGLCVDICASDSLNMSKNYVYISKEADNFYFLPQIAGIHGRVDPLGYHRDEVSELLDLGRRKMNLMDISRKSSFLEIVEGFSKEMAFEEASRCVSCGICTSACPAAMHIPEYITSVWKDDLEGGLRDVYKTNPLGNVCGRICTHKCEEVCALGHRGDPIAIRWLKRYIVDHVEENVYTKVATESVLAPTMGKIAVIGSGPSGLSCAYYLRTLGYDVVVYEKQALPGGVIRYGGPAYRLPEESVIRDISMIEASGVEFKCSVDIGTDITLEQLKNKYDAVFLGIGMSESQTLELPGCNHEAVYYGIPFLAEARDYTRGLREMPEIHESAVVVGTGNVAFDVARTLVRMQEIKYGKSDVHMTTRRKFGTLSADVEEVEEGTEEGIHIHYEVHPRYISSENNRLEGLVVESKPGYEETISVKSIYIAAGQVADYKLLPQTIKNEITPKGKLIVNGRGQVESHPWLFAGGDITKGPDIINGVHTGHVAALGIDEWLRGNK
ncbi:MULTISPECIES: FAD-dependent oxidoreductase [unclassified Fusibacter]|uniref:FAD-dependent oxidoreductase n=1 Tax=unclassified Fusibacter TaxID=2624464 RepID=UPI001010DB1E|nr:MULTISPECIES: FAD-dependent oxidoreductase [unclassified Fusibacter]MCK8060051.1 FAD-dependent oxidoreductase [Fusibacter sp. A2]NPE22193.1 FAD-dependent oxidoreductase [Fusibacter sp. A1]RXV60969.1 4Fe-4S dicluster domain-containing protein [Fusibacter sp. A1]